METGDETALERSMMEAKENEEVDKNEVKHLVEEKEKEEEKEEKEESRAWVGRSFDSFHDSHPSKSPLSAMKQHLISALELSSLLLSSLSWIRLPTVAFY